MKYQGEQDWSGDKTPKQAPRNNKF